MVGNPTLSAWMAGRWDPPYAHPDRRLWVCPSRTPRGMQEEAPAANRPRDGLCETRGFCDSCSLEDSSQLDGTVETEGDSSTVQ